MENTVSKFVNSEAEKFFSELLNMIPKSRHEEAKKLFSTTKEKINGVFDYSKIYLRYKNGQVAEFKNVYDVAKNIDYNVVTLENYLRKGKGYFEFSGYAISIVPIEEKISEQGFWFRAPNGKIQKFDSLEKLAKVSGLKPDSAALYLRKGDGLAQTKRGQISNKPMEELSFQDMFSLTYYNKTGRWPDANEIPHDPNDKRRY